MYKLIKPLLFKIEPEKAHGLTIDALKIAQKQSYVLPIMKKLFDYQNQCYLKIFTVLHLKINRPCSWL